MLFFVGEGSLCYEQKGSKERNQEDEMSGPYIKRFVRQALDINVLVI
uniref:Uncharacterized protein n=1 Tax=Scleropages formosus TaxID=113540 RepID=A0A8C9TBH1_SCLFO